MAEIPAVNKANDSASKTCQTVDAKQEYPRYQEVLKR